MYYFLLDDSVLMQVVIMSIKVWV